MLIRKMMGSSIATGTGFQAFVAPAAWTDASQFATYGETINIVDAYNAYSNTNKKYVFSVGSTATTVLPVVPGQSYAYAENGGSYTVITSGTVTWTVGSTMRHVIVIHTATTTTATIYNGAVWCYAGEKATNIYARYVATLKYVHFKDLNLFVSAINIFAFQNCTGLTGTLTIPSSVTSIGGNAFQGCSGLTGSLTIPSSITSIGSTAFYGCSGLTGTLTIPNSITIINADTFSYCTGFTGLSIGNSVTSIGASAFQNCTGLTGSLTIPSSVTSIGAAAFYNCIGLTGTLTIPSSVTSIGDTAFRTCRGFTGLSIGSSVTSIAANTFYNCTGLTGTLTIPSSVTSIGGNAFVGCSGITRYDFYPLAAPTITGTPFGGYAKPLHIKASGTSGYGVAPWTTTAIFSSITADL